MTSIENLVNSLTPEDFDFTVDVNGTRYDVYHFTAPNKKVGTIALGIKDGKAIVPMIRVGRMTAEEVEVEIAETELKQ